LKKSVSVVGAWISSICALVALSLGNPEARAAPVDDAEKTEVLIQAGDAVLAATLYRPQGAKGNLPAVVIGHGSGRVTRENTFWANEALSSGFAALAFDKRGTGQSTGSYIEWDLEKTPQMFEALASDMNHAARWLAMQKGIDRNRIGMMGGSQAGWVLPLAASQEPAVKFLIIGEGVPLPVAVEVLHGEYLDLISDE
jgi:uncharacterized protein